MKRVARKGATYLWNHITSRDREERKLIVAAILLVGITVSLLMLVGNVLEGDTQHFDEQILRGLRKDDNPAQPIGPSWLKIIAEDITALGSATVLGLTVFAVVGFLALQGMH